VLVENSAGTIFDTKLVLVKILNDNFILDNHPQECLLFFYPYRLPRPNIMIMTLIIIRV